jgi:hypothetical protein
MNAKIKLFRFKKNDNFVLSKKANNTRYYKELIPVSFAPNPGTKGCRFHQG